MPDMEAFLLKRQAEIIERVGWAVMHVPPHAKGSAIDVPFSYTVGLTAHRYPELLMSGLPPEVAQSLLNDLAGRVYDKAEQFSHGQRIGNLIAGYDAVVVDGSAKGDLVPTLAFARYGLLQVRLQQVIWPDPEGRFPWEAGYGYEPQDQPLISHLRP